MDKTNVTITRRSGSSFARGITMDLLLSQEDTRVLYERWKNDWGEPLMFRAGEIAITAEMVAAVSLEELVSVYGKQRAARLLDVATKNAVV